MRAAWMVAIAICTAECSALTDLSELGAGSDAGGGDADAGLSPIQIGAGDSPWMIVVDGDSIYWTDYVGNTVTRANKLDGSGTIVLANGQGAAGFGPEGIAVDATDVYWTSVEGLFKCAKTGCQNAPIIMPVNDPSITPRAVALDDTDAYVLSDDGHVLRFAKSGSAPSQLAYFPTNDGLNIVADAANVYVSFASGAIIKLAKGTGTTVSDAGTTDAGTVLTGTASPTDPEWMLVGGSRLYYSQGDIPGQITYVDVNGFQSGTGAIATQQNAPMGLATDGTTLYWANFGNVLSQLATGSIMQCAFASCQPTVVADSQYLPRSVAVDSTGLYWETGGNGTAGAIWRLPK